MTAAHNHPEPMLKTLSERCPNLLITCFSHDALPDPSVAQNETCLNPTRHAYFRGKALAEPSVQFREVEHIEAGADQVFSYVFSRRLNRERNHFLDWATRSKTLWILETFLPREDNAASPILVRWRPTLNAVSQGGPEALATLVAAQDALPGGDPAGGAIRLAEACRRPSGFGLIDAAIASSIQKFAQTPLSTFVGAWAPRSEAGHLDPEHKGIFENNVCHLAPEKVSELAALCATNDALAAFVGSDAGRLAHGIHVVGLMAILAKQGTPENLGVANILRHATFTLPLGENAHPPSPSHDTKRPPQGSELAIGMSLQHRVVGPHPNRIQIRPCPALGDDNARLHTLYALAASSNEHAWDYLLEQTAKGAIRGFDSKFLAGSVIQHTTDDLPRFLERYGSEAIKAVAKGMKKPLNAEIVAAIAIHDQHVGLTGILSAAAKAATAPGARRSTS